MVARLPYFNGTQKNSIYYIFYFSYKTFEETHSIHFNSGNIPIDT